MLYLSCVMPLLCVSMLRLYGSTLLLCNLVCQHSALYIVAALHLGFPQRVTFSGV